MKLIQAILSILFIALLIPITAFTQTDPAESGVVDSTIIITDDTLSGIVALDSETEASSTGSLYPMDDTRKQLLIDYSRFKNIWRFVSFFVGLATLFIILASGLSAKFRDCKIDRPEDAC